MKLKGTLFKGLTVFCGVASLSGVISVNAISDFSNKSEASANEAPNKNDTKEATLEEFLNSNKDYEVVFEDKDVESEPICIVAKKDETQVCKNVASQDPERSLGFKPFDSFFDKKNNTYVLVATPNAVTDEESNLI